MTRIHIKGMAIATLVMVLATAVPVQQLAAQGSSDPEHTLPLTWDRWLDHDEIGERLRLMERTWPEFLTLQSTGTSYGGREMWVMTINNPRTGDEMNKAAMFIEANVHGNEIQGAEITLYTIWYLMENYGRIDEITRLVDERVFHLVPSVNPDGRDYFMDEAGSGARTGHVPVDSDGDGVADEDGPEDLNGNGIIEQIRKYVPAFWKPFHRGKRAIGSSWDGKGSTTTGMAASTKIPSAATTRTGTTRRTGSPTTSRAVP